MSALRSVAAAAGAVAALAVAGCTTAPEVDGARSSANASTPGTALGAPAVPGPVVTVRAPRDERPVRFVPWVVELEVGDVPVAAYQIEVVVRSGAASVVGVEGGDVPGFDEPPHYDPAALAGGRIVIAAFNTRVSLSPGRHRVATLHMREAGEAPVYEVRLTAAAGTDGSPAAVAGVGWRRQEGADG